MVAPRKVEAKKPIITELMELEAQIEELRVQYEQYFSAFIPRMPESLHRLVRRKIVTIRKLPFKNTEHVFKLRTIENRYQIYNTYWMRVLREKEAGTYFKDIFKAELKDALQKEEAYKKTSDGKRDEQLKHLFNSYEDALKKATGKSKKLNFNAFKNELLTKAQNLKEKFPDKKVKFAIVVKNGSVQVQAKAT